MRQESSFITSHGYAVVSHHLLKSFSLPHWNFVLWSKFNWPPVPGLLPDPYSVPLIYRSVLTPRLHYLNSCSVTVGLKIERLKPFSVTLLIQNAPAILGPANLHASFRLRCQYQPKHEHTRGLTVTALGSISQSGDRRHLHISQSSNP